LDKILNTSSTLETGFWSTNPRQTKNLIEAHRAAIGEIYGGDIWEKDADVLAASIDDAVIVDGSQYKESHFPEFDDGEVFVKEIQNFTRMSWKKFLERY